MSLTITPLSSEALTALKGSITKWKMVAEGTITDRGTANCPLCQLFYGNQDCEGCPVAQFTGKPRCNGTPYVEWEDFGYHDHTATTPRQKELALAEVKFLESLLPSSPSEPSS